MQPIPPEMVIPADLSDWCYRAQRNTIVVDPVLGRIVFPAGQLPRQGVTVTYYYGFSADMGAASTNGRYSSRRLTMCRACRCPIFSTPAC